MDNEELLKRITFNPSIFGGKPIIRGMRIAVEHILGMLAAGSTTEELLEGYPFLNKEDIILGILNRMLDFDHLLEKELLTKKSTQNKVRQFIQFHFDYLEKNHEMTSILFSEDIFDHSDVLRNRFLFIIKKRRNKLNSILQKAKTNSEIVDADMQELLTLIFGMIRMIVLEWRLSNFSFLLSQRGKNAINTLDELIFKN